MDGISNALRASLQERVGPLTVQLPSMEVAGLGTCFVIGAMGAKAIAVTALHCLDEAQKHDVPDRVASAPGALFTTERPERIWNRIELGAVIAHRDLPPFMSLPIEVEEAYSNGATDIAFLLITPSEEYRGSVSLDRQIDLLSTGPTEGEKVLVVGFFETTVDTSHHRETDGRAALQVTRGQFQVVSATVKKVFGEGIRDLKWPCFQLDCPLFSGMSGGCVLVQRGTEYLAAGVVSRDLTLDAKASGAEAFAALIHPALTTAFPAKTYQREGEEQTRVVQSISDLIAVGVIKDSPG